MTEKLLIRTNIQQLIIHVVPNLEFRIFWIMVRHQGSPAFHPSHEKALHRGL